jgi:hypothetical protein
MLMQQAKVKSDVQTKVSSLNSAKSEKLRRTINDNSKGSSLKPSPTSSKSKFSKYLPSLILGIGTLISIVVSNTTPKAQANTEVKKCETSDFYCYGSRYALLAYDKSSKDAYDQMKADYKTDTYVVAQCHQLAHIIGRTIYKKTGDLTKTFAEGDSFCWSGYHHGVIEQAIGTLGATKIKTQLNTICDAFSDKTRYSFDHFNCVHGLGHGMMTIEGFELFTAQRAAKALMITGSDSPVRVELTWKTPWLLQEKQAQQNS